jgi:hypothetical protein
MTINKQTCDFSVIFPDMETRSVSAQDTAQTTYFVVKWENVFQPKPQPEDLIELQKLLAKHNASQTFKAEFNSEKTQAIKAGYSAGKLDIGECREQLKANWGLANAEDGDFDTVMLSLSKISTEQVKALQEINDIIQDSHVEVLVVGSPLFYEQYAVNMQLPEFHAKESHFHFASSRDHGTLDTNALIKAGLEEAGASSNDAIFTTFATEGEYSDTYIKVTNLGEFEKLVSEIAQPVAELPGEPCEAEAPIFMGQMDLTDSYHVSE